MSIRHPRSRPRPSTRFRSVSRSGSRRGSGDVRAMTPPFPGLAGAAATADLAAIGAFVADAGPAASHALLAHVADRAVARGLGSSASGILTDPTAPDVVRNRAYAVVSTRLAASAPASGESGEVAQAEVATSAPPAAA